MIFKKINVSNAAFSQSVVAAVLISSGFFSNFSLYAQDLSIKQDDKPAVCSSLYKKFLPKDNQQPLSEASEVLKITQDEGVFIIPSFFVYTQDAQWSLPPIYEKLIPTKHTLIQVDGSADNDSQPTQTFWASMDNNYSSLRFVGEGSEAGVAFFNAGETNLPTIRSNAQIIFENLQKGVFFNGFQAAENGGALNGQSLVLQNNYHVSFEHCSSSESQLTHDALEPSINQNGGAIYAFQSDVHAADIDTQSTLNGYVFINKNKNVNFKENHADYGNGGAVSCYRFLCLDNDEVGFHKNHALLGGAIASNTGIVFHGNKKKLEFISNQATNESGFNDTQNTLFNGGALFAKHEVIFQNNFGIACISNTATSCGGAVYGESVNVTGNAGENKFKGNLSSDRGGAVYSRSFTITQNPGDVLFVENSAKEGGAVYCDAHKQEGDPFSFGDVDISRNLGLVSFANNLSNGVSHEFCGGGAIWCNNIDIYENKNPVAFYANKANATFGSEFVGGGAVLAKNKVRISENTGIVNIDSNQHGIFDNDRTREEGISRLRGGGAFLSKEIEISNNNLVAFSKNMVNLRKDAHVPYDGVIGGGALLGVDSVHLCGNNGLSFQDNFALGTNVSGGAILAKKVKIADNTMFECSRNLAQLFGGAICSLEQLVITGNQGDMLISGNKTTTAGGALASLEQDIILAHNQGTIKFERNIASGDFVTGAEPINVEFTDTESQKDPINTSGFHSGGGALFAKTGVKIVHNTNPILFSENTAGSFGGAILSGRLDCPDEPLASYVMSDGSFVEITDNGSDVTFVNNCTIAEKHPEHNLFGGGAIHTQNLTIARNQGTVTFSNNQANTGGAIRIADHGKVILSATSGNIIFQGNQNRYGESDGIYFSGAHSRIDSLSAAQGSCIQFGDALIFENLALRKNENEQFHVLAINDDPTYDCSGEVRFSSSISKIPHVVHLKKGTLALTDGAQLWVSGFKQQIGSHILLSAGTSLRICDFHAQEKVDADIHSLNIDLSSFTADGDLLPAPELVVPANSGIQERGLDILLVDLLGSGYENHNLLNQDQSFTFVSLCTSKDGSDPVKVVLDPENIRVHTPEITDQTYGHIGEWSSARVVDGSVVLDWKPTGYRLNPEKAGNIVPNSLWSTCYDLRLIKEQQLNHQQTVQRMDFDYSMNVCVSGLGTMVDCSTKNMVDGFIQRTAGIGLALDAHPFDDLLIGVGFYQMYGDVDSKEFMSTNTRHGLIGSCYSVISSGSWLFKFGGAVSSTQNHLNTNYRVLGESKGEWEVRGVLWNTQADYRYIVNPKTSISNIISAVVPFAGVELTRVESQGFLETGSEARQFEQGSLKNITVPCGISLEQYYAKGQRSEVNSISVTYAIDVYRSFPDIQVALPQISLSWNTPAIDLATQTLKVQFSNNSEWNSYFSTFLSGSYSLGEHSKEYSVHTGVRLIF